MLLSELVSFFAILISVFLSRRIMDQRSISSLGVDLSKKVVPDLAVGFMISLLSLVLVFVLEILFGWIHNVSFAWQTQSPISVISGSIIALILFIMVGWNEELLSRGYHLQTLTSGLNLPFGVIISSAIFGILHLTNPNATWVSVIGIFLAGLFLAFGYIRTHKLWLSIGLHIGWNFTEGVLLGFPVSGWNGYQLTRIKINGPVIWTGGAFGPEAGLIILPALILGIILIYLYTQPFSRK
jgi:membrane protease YdiL (CAAX protease family)